MQAKEVKKGRHKIFMLVSLENLQLVAGGYNFFVCFIYALSTAVFIFACIYHLQKFFLGLRFTIPKKVLA